MDEDECMFCPDWNDAARAIHDLCEPHREYDTVSASPLSMLLAVMTLRTASDRLRVENTKLIDRLRALDELPAAEPAEGDDRREA